MIKVIVIAICGLAYYNATSNLTHQAMTMANSITSIYTQAGEEPGSLVSTQPK